MESNGKTSRILGLAFLLQFVTSFGNGVFLLPQLVVEDNVIETMTRIAANPSLMRTFIFVDMLTALGIIFLGAVLFTTLRKQSENLALTALAFYILETILLAASRGSAYSLMQISGQWAAGGQPETLQVLAELSMGRMHYVGMTLMMIGFCPGAILFYSMLDKARIVPRWLSLWGLITVIPVTVAMLLIMFGIEVPFFIFAPYVPFEFVIGLWVLIKGIQVEEPVGRESRPVSTLSAQPQS